jgi:hypothetical protein
VSRHCGLPAQAIRPAPSGEPGNGHGQLLALRFARCLADFARQLGDLLRQPLISPDQIAPSLISLSGVTPARVSLSAFSQDAGVTSVATCTMFKRNDA